MDTEQYRKLFSESAVKVKDTESGIDVLVYRLTGLTLQEVMELKERDTAKEPVPYPVGADGMECRGCGKKALPWDRFCPECGQRFWED